MSPAYKCIVCGTGTDKQCAPCAAAGVSIPFCGPEHQRVIWKTHKAVCGPESNPFRHPPLTAEEVSAAKDLGRIYHRTTDGRSRTLADLLRPTAQAVGVSYIQLLDYLAGPSPTVRRKTGLSSLNEYNLRYGVRNFLGTTSSGPPRVNTPFVHLATFLKALADTTAQQDLIESQKWYAPLMHRVLAYCMTTLLEWMKEGVETKDRKMGVRVAMQLQKMVFALTTIS